jgi:hypothetical protein
MVHQWSGNAHAVRRMHGRTSGTLTFHSAVIRGKQALQAQQRSASSPADWLPHRMEFLAELGRMNKRQLLLQGLNLGEHLCKQ